MCIFYVYILDSKVYNTQKYIMDSNSLINQQFKQVTIMIHLLHFYQHGSHQYYHL